MNTEDDTFSIHAFSATTSTHDDCISMDSRLSDDSEDFDMACDSQTQLTQEDEIQAPPNTPIPKRRLEPESISTVGYVQQRLKKRRLGRELWIVGRVTMDGLFNLILDCECVQDHPFWSRLTHVFFEGLQLWEGVVRVHPGAERYIPFWRALRAHHPHLYVGWSMPPPLLESVNLARWIQTRPFWDSLCDVKLKLVTADYLELNLESVMYREGTIPLGWEDALVVVIPNRLTMLKDVWTMNRLVHCHERCAKLVVNTFGFLNLQQQPTSHGLVELIQPTSECGLQSTLELMNHLVDFIPQHRFLMGIDTQAVKFMLSPPGEEQHVVRMEIVSRRQVENERTLGIREVNGKRTFKYKEIYDHQQQGSLLELKRKQQVISYDSFRVLNRKYNMVIDDGYGGVVVGRLDADLDCRQAHSILFIAYNKLSPLGLAPRVIEVPLNEGPLL
jgi:hypothetical protein